MTPAYISTDGEARELARTLADSSSIALDCEAAGFHRYSDRLCLIQISTRDRTFLVDPLAFDPAPLLRDALEDPDMEIVMHGADFDIRLLDRDLDVQLRGLFDTQVAAAMLGERALGLSSLLGTRLGVKVSKKYQRADWARRPLPEDMREYAASDTRHLHELADILRERLREEGRLDWAMEECRALEEVRFAEDPEEDPVVRVKDTRGLDDREVTVLREALRWRDRIARERDRAHFRVVGDQALLEVVRERPASAEELGRIHGFSPGLARQEGEALLERLDTAWALPEGELVPYPASSGNGRSRPPPEVEERARRLKGVRNRVADELGMDRGALIPNALLEEIARHEPEDMPALRKVPGLRKWHTEAAGKELLAALNAD